jgi:hypothetical protein
MQYHQTIPLGIIGNVCISGQLTNAFFVHNLRSKRPSLHDFHAQETDSLLRTFKEVNLTITHETPDCDKTNLRRHRMLRKSPVIIFVVAASLLAPSRSSPGSFTYYASNANGVYSYTANSITCTDPNTGYRATYLVFEPFTWTPKGGTTHSFDAETDEATDGGVCGDVDTPTSDGGDGSGFQIHVFAYHSATIHDPSGNQVYP